MPALFLLIPDLALREAVIEQIDVARLGPAQLVDTVQAFVKQAAGIENAVLIIDEAAYDKKAAAALFETAGQSSKPFILMLGGKDDNEGVSETFAKPLRLGHLMTRLRYYIETAPLLREHSVRFGCYRLEPQNRRIISLKDNSLIHVTEKETALLVFLSDHAAGVSRRDILAGVWGYDERIDTHTLETHLYQLRRKLESEWLVAEGGLYTLARGEEA